MDDLLGGALVGVACAAAFLAVGLAHYRGALRSIADPYRISPFTGLAAAWLGGGALLTTAGACLLRPSVPALDVLGLVLGVLGIASWLVGLVGIVWLPRRLRPEWLRDLLEDPAFLERNGRTRRAAQVRLARARAAARQHADGQDVGQAR